MDKNKILASILIAPAADIPAIVATAINQWTSDGSSITDLLKKVAVELGEPDDGDLRDEFEMCLEDWT